MKLKNTIYSFFNPSHIYGHAGEGCTLIKRSGHVLLVHAENGQKFAVNENDVTEDDAAVVKKEVVEEIPTVNKAVAKKQKKAVAPMPDLFQ